MTHISAVTLDQLAGKRQFVWPRAREISPFSVRMSSVRGQIGRAFRAWLGAADCAGPQFMKRPAGHRPAGAHQQAGLYGQGKGL